MHQHTGLREICTGHTTTSQGPQFFCTPLVLTKCRHGHWLPEKNGQKSKNGTSCTLWQRGGWGVMGDCT
ncbi:hypothetical protein Q7C36_008211 [Tachysurus vachellii]|uniref:Uncharacterized protein n=1 Tax=Tachysurus vachellii TaxID=175792 RepID=A0AA88NG17_TACVA|nr:hypothetical protein Q7C36_008211 [Tachysurus vachellii]